MEECRFPSPHPTPYKSPQIMNRKLTDEQEGPMTLGQASTPKTIIKHNRQSSCGARGKGRAFSHNFIPPVSPVLIKMVSLVTICHLMYATLETPDDRKSSSLPFWGVVQRSWHISAFIGVRLPLAANFEARENL